MEPTPRHSCLKLQIPNQSEPIFIKATWFPSHFHLSITDSLHTWLCNASEDEVRERAAQWDQPVSDYIALAERFLGFQQPSSVYGFSDAGDGHRRLPWTFEKEGTKLEWRWKCGPFIGATLATLQPRVSCRMLGAVDSKSSLHPCMNYAWPPLTTCHLLLFLSFHHP